MLHPRGPLCSACWVGAKSIAAKVVLPGSFNSLGRPVMSLRYRRKSATGAPEVGACSVSRGRARFSPLGPTRTSALGSVAIG